MAKNNLKIIIHFTKNYYNLYHNNSLKKLLMKKNNNKTGFQNS